jgi:hypothetical protein
MLQALIAGIVFTYDLKLITYNLLLYLLIT